MKDRMIIIREGVMFIITVTHDRPQTQEKQEAPAADKENTDQEKPRLPDITLSAN